MPASSAAISGDSDAGVLVEVQVVASALDRLSVPHRTAAIASLDDLVPVLQSSAGRVVFNLVENLAPITAHAALVPSICRALGREVTGNDTPSQCLCLDKWQTKAILAAAGLKVPPGTLVAPGARLSRQCLPKGPLIIKPLFADASEGIDPQSVVKGPGPALARAITRVHRDFNHPALVESFFGTRELNVALFERNGKLVVMPPAEIEFRDFSPGMPRIVDYKAKWQPDSFEYQHTVRVIPARLPARTLRQVEAMARTAWTVAGCRDYARVDFRMTEAGELAILEINPNPDISPDAGFAAALKAARIPVHVFIDAMCRNALRRIESAAPVRRRRKTTRREEPADTRLRWSLPQDREPIIAFAQATGFFLPNEITVAAEVLDEALKAGASGHYQSYTLTVGDEPAGWICFGPTPCTIGTYDIYWIAVSPRFQGRGFGRALLDHAEAEIRKREGRVLILETSGRPLYQSTRGFYLAAGYREVARVPEFYTPGDDRVIYAKYLHS
jgi:D-alanine-D-alanine ligase